MELEVFCAVVSNMQSNCFAVRDKKSKKAFVVDCGEYCKAVENMLLEHGIDKIEYILLTHGHFDHIMGAKKLKESFGGKIVISKEDEACFKDKHLSLLDVFGFDADLPQSADITVCGGDELPFADGSIKALHTPGHTRGGMCFAAQNLLFTGDTLFNLSIGRSDFPGGDSNTLLKSVKMLSKLDGNFDVYPGHGEKTTLEEQRWSNPYMNL